MSDAEVAILNERVGNIRSLLDTHVKECAQDKMSMTDRLARIERLIFIGIGGLCAVGALATFFGWNILKVLGH